MTSLGSSLAPLFGREGEAQALLAALAAHRLVTIVGTAGVGKTRLALEVTRRLDPPGGVSVVDATELHDAQGLLAAIEERPAGRDGPALLILDGLERAADDSAALLPLFARAPELRVLVTSRRPLRLDGERLFSLEPLALPRTPDDVERAPASAFFLERARLEAGSVELPADSRAAVVAIVARLDGVPLLLEMGAARLRFASLGELARDLATSLDAIAGPRRGGAPRHRSLATAIAPSLELLTPIERHALTQLGIFEGPFSAAAAARVAALGESSASFALVLEALADASLIAPAQVAGSPVRLFRLFELVRWHAVTALSREASRGALEARHAAHVLEAATAPGIDPIPHDITAALRRLSNAIEAVLRAPTTPTEPLALGLLTRAGLFDAAGDPPRARSDRARAAELLERCPSPRAAAALATGRALAAQSEGRLEEARAAFEETLAMYLALGDLRGALDARLWLAAASRELGHLDAAREHAERAALEHEGKTRAALEIAAIALERGEIEEAERLADAALARARSRGEEPSAAGATTLLGLVRLEQGRLHEADTLFDEAIAAHRVAGRRRLEAEAAVLSALAGEALGSAPRARARLEAATTFAAEVGSTPGEAMAWLGIARLDASLGHLDEARRALDAARPHLFGVGRPDLFGVYDLAEAALTLAESEAARARRDEAGAEALRSRAAEALAACPSSSPAASLRIARGSLARLMGEPSIHAPSPREPRGPPPPSPHAKPDSLIVSTSARWFRPPRGDRVSLDTRRALRLILGRLAEQREKRPGAALPLEALLEAGWPGERVLHEAGVSRVYAAVSHLRREGLRDVLSRRDDGYLLDPSVELYRDAD